MKQSTSMRSIHTRPAHVESRRQAGNWEGDLSLTTIRPRPRKCGGASSASPGVIEFVEDLQGLAERPHLTPARDQAGVPVPQGVVPCRRLLPSI
jgi:hypothetical protein